MTEPNEGARPETADKTQQPSATDDTPLGDAGKRALEAEREARKALEQQLKKLQQETQALEPLKTLAQALGVKPEPGKTDVEELTQRIAAMEQQARDAELRAIRAEVAAAKKLPPALAARLQGSSREELEADADTLLSALPQVTPGTPAPDPSQGARGGASALEAQLKAAQEKGDIRAVIRLKQEIAAAKK